jgi:hypothetical protein
MTTRMEILTKEYLKFNNDINLIDNSYSHLFPSLEDVDIVDLLFFFNFTFKPGEDYNKAIYSLMENNNIIVSTEDYNKAYPIIKDFINFLFNFQKL